MLVHEREDDVCCSFTLGENCKEHMMRKPDMDELDVSLEVEKIWEDRTSKFKKLYIEIVALKVNHSCE